jgi:purine-cytosine permease-like protein
MWNPWPQISLPCCAHCVLCLVDLAHAGRDNATKESWWDMAWILLPVVVVLVILFVVLGSDKISDLSRYALVILLAAIVVLVALMILGPQCSDCNGWDTINRSLTSV